MRPKELFFFCTDIAAQRAPAPGRNICVSLMMRTAHAPWVKPLPATYAAAGVRAILERLPDARFVVCLRNPVDMVVSVHGQMLRGCARTSVDLATALALEPERLRGLRLPGTRSRRT